MNHAKPDDLVELDKITGTAIIVSDETGEAVPILCDLRLYRHMLWCGDGFPRCAGGLSIEGSVWKRGETFWAHRNIGKQFLLTSGERKVHFLDRKSVVYVKS